MSARLVDPLPPSLIIPPALPEGGTLGIVSPGSAPEPERLEAGLAALHELGFKTVLGEHVCDRYGHLAGSDEERAADLMGMFLREDVDAILCARGGSGSIRLLDRLDYEAIRAHPKPLIGYSDITVLQLALLRRAGLPSLFAAMAAPDFGAGLDPDCLATTLRLLHHPAPVGDLVDPRCAAESHTLVPGQAEGPCVGGTLSLIVALVGTPYEPLLDDAVFFFEDVHENPAHIERYLMHLKLAGLLDRAAGFLIGHALWEAGADDEERFLEVEQVYRDLLLPLGKPAFYGFPCGHVPSPVPLPLGVRIRLDADRRRVQVVAPLVR